MSGDTLTPKMRRAIIGLLTCGTEAGAAKHAGVGAATLRRWKAEAGFRDELRAASRALLDETTAKLRADAERARRVLRHALSEPAAGVRVRAAIALLTLASAAESDELARRIEALEQNTKGAET